MSKDTAFVVLGTDDEYDDGLSASPRNLFQRAWWSRKLSKEGLKDAYNYVAHPNGSPLWTEIKSNLKPGITVSLVSVPLSISLAIAGGASPVMGIVTAFWAGIVAALLGGSHYNIVGPTGALSGVLAASASTYGVQALPVLAVISGILCFLVWLFKLDRYIMFIPSSVIHGFTVGVAFIIGLNQLNSAFGLTVKVKHESFVMNTLESLKTLPETNLYALGFFIINLSALVLLSRKFPKMPWAIVIAAIGILVGFLTSKEYIPITLKTLQSSYGDLTMKIVSVPELDSRIFSFGILTSSFGVAFIAILETLISARIADGMTRTEHNQSKEVLSISLSNVLCGVMGGIPATAALARTALNIKTGATSRVAGIINCVSVLLISLVFLPFFKYIPMSTIAALLVMTAIKMVAMEHLKHMFHHDKKMFWISILSAATCVVMDTMAGIMVGGIVSLLLFTDQMSVGHTDIQLNKGARLLSSLNLVELDKGSKRRPKNSSEMSLINKDSEETEEFGDTIVYRVTGQLTYVNSIAHVKRIKKLAKDHEGLKHVILSLRHLWYADLDGVDALQDMISALESKKIQVYIAGVVHETVKNALERHPFYQTKVSTGAVYANHLDCLKELDQGKEEAVEVSIHDSESPKA